MHTIQLIRESLKAILLDDLKASKIMSRELLEETAREHGFVPESATRAFRMSRDEYLPVIKLNRFKKPIQGRDKICFFKWGGGVRLVFNKKIKKPKLDKESKEFIKMMMSNVKN
jgi:hypothetical protein